MEIIEKVIFVKEMFRRGSKNSFLIIQYNMGTFFYEIKGATYDFFNAKLAPED